MKKETMKSVILVILIAFSLVLTVALWTYQPMNEPLEEDVFIEDTRLEEIGSERTIPNLVPPDEVVFHEQNSYFTFKDNIDLTAFYQQQMQQWNLSNFDTSPRTINVDNHSEIVEIIFPAHLPVQVISDIFKVNEGIPMEGQQANFNRIFLLRHSTEGSAASSSSYDLWFVNSDGEGSEVTLQADISAAAGERAIQEVDNKDEMVEMSRVADFLQINPEDRTNASHIYVPKNPVSISEYVLQTGAVNVKPIQNDIFPSNTRVFKSRTNSGENITKTIQRRLTQYDKRMEYDLTIPNSANQKNLTEYELFVQSMEDINSHLGWTDDYRLNSILSGRDEVRYRLYFNDRPVLENVETYKLASIQLSYQQGQIQEYDRPLVQYSSINESETNLLSGEEVLLDLQRDGELETSRIRDLKIMYTIEEQRSELVYSLIPEWYMLTNSGWTKVYPEEKSQNAEVS
ncbi:YycH family regulatory protein [Halobacillus sp. Nhm2S1]|uniref:YycH family regulatory protein n=1 Tax=Halobacillus sp. Nhm2S1 TaxID=2866716 RepID=UPI001C73D6BE|nr:two-component system activity regulator YycH [Halobacillus sp. Nhm2S1]MBX0358257.1 hypothetical protein [Halobacillus sp. Nhm2S1]